MEHFLLGAGTGDSEADQKERIGTADHSGQQVFEYLMVNGWKGSYDILPIFKTFPNKW
jgi:hypothetical protein